MGHDLPSPGSSVGAGLRQVLSRLQEMPLFGGSVNQSRPNAEPNYLGAGTLHSFYTASRLIVGVITDSTAVCDAYRVQFEKLQTPLICSYSSKTSHSAFGARELNTLQPGSTVLCFVHDKLSTGVILCVLPPINCDEHPLIGDQISQAGRTRVDEAHKAPVRMGETTLNDWSAGQPIDLTTGGEWGAISETGIRVFLDSFMAQVAVDDTCGLFAFYHDQLLRLAAYNLQLWTAGHEREGLDDQGEYDEYNGWTPYPWEQQGLFTRGDPHIENAPEIWQVKEPHKAAYEPKDDRAQPWHREQEFHGYLGQGSKRIVVAPPYAPANMNLYGQPTELIGLYDHSVGLNGQVGMQTAKGFAFVKRLGICAPKRLERAEQPTADNETNYKAAGIVGSGPAHTITGDFIVDAELPQLQRAAGIQDLHAYLFNYSGLHPFFWHEKDWAVPEESALKHTRGRAAITPTFMQLAGSMYLQPPGPVKIKIDHRYGEQDYFQNELGIVGLEDGGVLIYDGFGSSLTMTAGSITIAAPGDIFLKAGRNVMAWAGRDAITRAKNSVDISATEKDVRIKAEANMQLLAGNGGLGGILLESLAQDETFGFEGNVGEAVQSSGIMFRCPHSSVVTWSKGVYLRTGGGDVAGGDIVVDANKGQSNIITNSSTFQNFVSSNVAHWFGQDGEITAGNVFRAKQFQLAGDGGVNGMLIVAGNIINKGNVIITEGHIITEKAKSASYLVGPLEGTGLSKAIDAVSAVENIANQSLPEDGKQVYQEDLTPQFYDAARPGNDTVIENAQFSFRTTDQYKTTDFKIFEDRWQQMARLSNQTPETWTERPVITRADPQTYPYPGKEAFQGDTLLQQELALFDHVKGNCMSRGTATSPTRDYARPGLSMPSPVALDGNYSVI